MEQKASFQFLKRAYQTIAFSLSFSSFFFLFQLFTIFCFHFVLSPSIFCLHHFYKQEPLVKSLKDFHFKKILISYLYWQIFDLMKKVSLVFHFDACLVHFFCYQAKRAWVFCSIFVSRRRALDAIWTWWWSLQHPKQQWILLL